MCEILGIKLVGVSSLPENHNLDLEAIDKAITPDTRAILVNSPNNPTGVIYDNDTLQRLGRMLDERNKERDSPIVLISDEVMWTELTLKEFLPEGFNLTVNCNTCNINI